MIDDKLASQAKWRCIVEAAIACLLLVFGGWMIGVELVPWWLGVIPVMVVYRFVVFLVLHKQMALIDTFGRFKELAARVRALEDSYSDGLRSGTNGNDNSK